MLSLSVHNSRKTKIARIVVVDEVVEAEQIKIFIEDYVELPLEVLTLPAGAVRLFALLVAYGSFKKGDGKTVYTSKLTNEQLAKLTNAKGTGGVERNLEKLESAGFIERITRFNTNEGKRVRVIKLTIIKDKNQKLVRIPERAALNLSAGAVKTFLALYYFANTHRHDVFSWNALIKETQTNRQTLIKHLDELIKADEIHEQDGYLYILRRDFLDEPNPYHLVNIGANPEWDFWGINAPKKSETENLPF